MKRPIKPKAPRKTRQQEAIFPLVNKQPPKAERQATTLQEMIDWAAQNGFDPKDVSFGAGFLLDCCNFDVDMDDIEVTVHASLATTVEVLNPLYDVQLEQYEKEMVQYQEKRAEYDAYRKDQQKAKTRAKIAELKAQQAKLEKELE